MLLGSNFAFASIYSICLLHVLRDLVKDDGLAVYPQRFVIGTTLIGSTSQGESFPLNAPLHAEQKSRVRNMLQEYFFQGDRLTFVGSLRRFHLLRVLRVNIITFVEPTSEDIMTRSKSSNLGHLGKRREI